MNIVDADGCPCSFCPNLSYHPYFLPPTTPSSKITLDFNKISACQLSPGPPHMLFQTLLQVRRIRNFIPPLRFRGIIGSALVGHLHLIERDVWGFELEGHIVVCGVCHGRGFQAPGSSDH